MRRASLPFLAAALSCAGVERLENLYEIAPGVLSGASPRGDASFDALAALGVRTVISVDGARPDVEGAKTRGLRYVHLPIGYDGVPAERVLELAKALRELPGPIYVHCHHGRHRGPAAAAVACVAAGKLDNAGALRAMKAMGTGEQYLGLWASAREARPVETESLRVTFLETAPAPPIREAMVALDQAFENLGYAQKAGWKTPPGHPDLDPAHEALRAREILTEFLRAGQHPPMHPHFHGWAKKSIEVARELEGVLRWISMPAANDYLYGQLRDSCVQCHRVFRDIPKKR